MIRNVTKCLLTVVALMSMMSVVSQAESPALMTRHTRDEVVNGVAPKVGHLSASQKMPVVLVLQHRNQADLDQFLKDVYDPSSPKYRQFLTVEEFTAKYGPSREDYESVKAFAKENGLEIRSTSANRMILQVSGSVSAIEKALHVTMGLYQHPTEARTFFAPDREPTPNLGVRLWAIGGLDNFSTPKAMYSRRDSSSTDEAGVKSNATIGSGPSQSFLGSDMRAAYYGGTALTGAGQSLGLFELIGTDLVDLTTYFTNVGQTNNVPVTLTSVDTQSTSCVDKSGCDDTEQTLDMTQAIGMAPGLSSLVMYIGTGALSGQTVDDLGILNAMATAKPLNAQLSCSWAWKPTDNTTDDPLFQEFAAQGQNYFTASGDSGNWAHASFVWPADDPYVVSVGGTDLDTSSAGGPWSSETAWVDGGGGISVNKFDIPSWQVAAAAGCAKCSQTLRNGPDISANANYSFYVCADQTKCTANNYGGTSFAAPMWAGFLALVNEQALANGEPLLGFLNPTLYGLYASSSSYAADFHDILTGGNSLGATVGYDLASGIGSPTAALINALAPVQSNPSFTISAAKVVKVAEGATGNTKVTTAISGGFDSSIALSASGQASGVTITFKPATIAAPGSGTSQMSIKVASTVKVGAEVITISGTGGGLTEKTTFTLHVVK